MSSIKLLFLLLFSLLAAPKGELDSIAKVQASWTKTQSYSARFTQNIFSKRMGTNETSTGEVIVQKPGKIRFDVKSEGNIQILNGKKLINVHLPKRKRATRVEIFENITKQMDTTGLSFLSGTTEFKEAYIIKILKETPKMVSLRMVSKSAPGVDTYIAEFDKSSYLLRSLVTESTDSRVRIEFNDIQNNPKVSQDLFDYKPGPNDVVTVNK